MLEEVKQKLENLLGNVQEVKSAVEAVSTAPSVEKVIVEGLVALLEAQGYTVTAPATPSADTSAPTA